MKARGTCIDWERNIIIYASSLEVSQIFLHFTLCPLKENSSEVSRLSLASPLRPLKEKLCHPLFTKCGEPCYTVMSTKKMYLFFGQALLKVRCLSCITKVKKKFANLPTLFFFYKNVTVTQAFFPWLNLKTWIFRRKMICQSF